MIYFDHNATTPVDERVLDAMQPFFNRFYGNPSSLYRLGRLSRSAIETAREQVAALVDAHPDQVVFTSGGTEANNLALTVVKPQDTLAISAIEHPSIFQPALRLQQQGVELKTITVNEQGIVRQDAIQHLAQVKSGLVSIMLANNETGAIQNLAEYSQCLVDKGFTLHTDAVQAAGKMPVSFKQLGVQLMSLSSHKIYGPKGCGALVLDKSIAVDPVQLGGGQERGLRPGTENVAAIIGFGKAAELARLEMLERQEKNLHCRLLLEQELNQIPGLSVFSADVDRLANTVQFAITGSDGEMLLMQLDGKGIAVSSASACASGGGQPSPVLIAMGVTPELAKAAIRISLGQANTETEIKQFINILKTLINQSE